ncbi:MAG: alpha/beta hydrolase [Methylococcaceae bacterium]|nr:alpha/beta hydrolase [Methylococcaceae bacterium]
MAFATDLHENPDAMVSRSVSSLGPHGFHRIHYTEWGGPGNPEVIVCVHGLTRNCRDFDDLAAALSKTHRVVCPDMPGRGRSEWLPFKEDYNTATYMADIAVLVGRLNVEEIGWVGTSMGGLIGMLLAAKPGSPIKRMLLNDIGPDISQDAQERIVQYLGGNPVFQNVASAERYFRTIHAPFGPLSGAQWKRLTLNSIKPCADGGYVLHYDPGIAEPFKTSRKSAGSLWEVWDDIGCPVQIFRGSESDLLSAQTAAAMLKRGPASRLTEFPGIGHAPSLMAEEQIEQVVSWFSE